MLNIDDPETQAFAVRLLDIFERLGFRLDEIPRNGQRISAEADALIGAVLDAEDERDKALATAAAAHRKADAAQTVIDAIFRAGRSAPALDPARGLATLEKLLGEDDEPDA